MRTYISPIGYDTRRVTRPVVNTGLSGGDTVHLIRPEQESETEQAVQAVADVEQLLQEIEPGANFVVTKITTESFEETVRGCCDVLTAVAEESETIVSLGGGARDILLPLTVSALVCKWQIEQVLFFSDLDSEIREWSLPVLTAQVPQRAMDSFETIVRTGEWISLSKIAEESDQSKSTVIRHVNDLESAGVVETETIDKRKRVRVSFSGELFQLAHDSGF